MITIKDFLECIDYRITNGSEYCWPCFGDNPHTLDYWNSGHEEDSTFACVVFDKTTQVVYQAEVWDGKSGQQYRWTHPAYTESYMAYEAEMQTISSDPDSMSAFIDLDVAADFLEKAAAIVAGKEYDTKVSVPIDIPDAELLEFMKMAHRLDITFNQLVERVLRAAINSANPEH